MTARAYTREGFVEHVEECLGARRLANKLGLLGFSEWVVQRRLESADAIEGT